MTLQAEIISVTCRFSPYPLCCQRYFPKRTVRAYYFIILQTLHFPPCFLDGLSSPLQVVKASTIYCSVSRLASPHLYTASQFCHPLIKSIWWIPTCISTIRPRPPILHSSDRYCLSFLCALSFLLPQGSLLLNLPISDTSHRASVVVQWWRIHLPMQE